MLLQTLGGSCPSSGTTRIEYDIFHQLNSNQPPTHLDSGFVLFPTRYAPYQPPELPAQSAGRPARGRQVRAKKHAIRQVAVLEVAGRLGDVVQDLDQAIQQVLAEGPRGVVCDLSGVCEGADPAAIDVLATAGRHVRDWPGVPVGVACPDPQVRAALLAHPLGKQLIVTESMFSALSTVLAAPTLTVQRRTLSPHPTAPRSSRDFVTQILNDWGLGSVIPFASIVVSDLVASSAVNAGTDIDLSVVWDRGALRIAVRDHGPALPGEPRADPDLLGRGLTVVAGASRTFGVLPAADGGELVWAVLDAPRPSSSTQFALSTAAEITTSDTAELA